MYEFLTLAIREKDPSKPQDDFGVVVMDMQSKRIHSFTLEKNEIVSPSGEIFWDIGFITRVKDVDKKADGKLVPSGYVDKKDATSTLKTILELKSKNPEQFFRNWNIDYAIVRVSKVSDITVEEKDGKIQSRITVTLNGLPASYRLDPLLNKDFRWIKYWTHIYNIDAVEDKKQQYLKLLNKKSKTLYLLLYRHTFYSGKKLHWIAGMHWL